MGKITGFMEYKRVYCGKRPVMERIRDWEEFRIIQDPDVLKTQGARCMNCGIPFCHGGVLLRGMAAGCPVRNLIPEWNELVYLGQWYEAYKRLIRTNPFPEFTARVCPRHARAPVEGAHHGTGGGQQPGICDHREGLPERLGKTARPKQTGKKIAVVGSGPSGLSAAYI
jgi:glutamate synthase (NADPH/NADH) small chain